MIRAAVASFGPHAVAGLQSAADLHGIGGAPDSPFTHLITPRRLGGGIRVLDVSIRCHQIDLADHDITVIDGIPVTTAARTLMDLTLLPDIVPRIVRAALAAPRKRS